MFNKSRSNVTAPDSEACEFSIYFKVTLCTLLMVTGLFSFLENIALCTVFYMNRNLHVKSSILIISLSSTDIITACTLSSIEFVYILTHPKWPLGSLGTDIQNSFWLFSLAMPFITVTAITVDRYLAITKSFQYNRFVTVEKIVIVVVFMYTYSLLWVVCMVLNFLPAPEDAYIWNVPATQYYIFLGIHIIIPLIVIPILYRKITSAVKLSRQETGKTRIQSREIRLAKRVAVVIIFLFIVWAPVVVLEIFYNLDFSNCIVEQAGAVSVWITCANGALNPIVYSQGNAEVKKCIRRLFGRKGRVAPQKNSPNSGH